MDKMKKKVNKIAEAIDNLNAYELLLLKDRITQPNKEIPTLSQSDLLEIETKLSEDLNVQSLSKKEIRILIEQARKSEELKVENESMLEISNQLVAIRELLGKEKLPEGVLEYAIGYPEGVYDMVVHVLEEKKTHEKEEGK